MTQSYQMLCSEDEVSAFGLLVSISEKRWLYIL